MNNLLNELPMLRSHHILEEDNKIELFQNIDLSKWMSEF